MQQIPHLIHGERVAGNGRSANVYNPAKKWKTTEIA